MAAPDRSSEPSPLPSGPTAPSNGTPSDGTSPIPSDLGTNADLAAPAENQPAANTSGPGLSSLAAATGLGVGGANIPNMIGDNFGGGQATYLIPRRVQFAFPASGIILQGGPTQANSVIGFVLNGSQTGLDLVTTGVGIDRDGDGDFDQFQVAEPVPPTNAPTSPGPNFTYDGGTASHATGLFDDDDDWDIAYSYSEPIAVVLPAPGGGGMVVGRMKIAENSSPLPRNRIFLNYSLFDNVPLLAGGVSVNRFSPGFETTFADGNYSLEMRVPFASTVDTNLFVDGPTERNHVELGDLFLAFKALLWQTQTSILSAGISMTVPTADDVNVSLADGTRLVTVVNETVHLMPFIGAFQTLSAQSFVHGFVQVDVDTNGNPVSANLDGRGLVPVGTIQDTTLLHLDGGWGYRLFPGGGAARRLTQIIPTVEMHYTRSLQDTDLIQAGNFRIGQFKERGQVLNVVGGVSFEFDHRDFLTLGYATPVGNGADQLFDGELRAFWNRMY